MCGLDIGAGVVIGRLGLEPGIGSEGAAEDWDFGTRYLILPWYLSRRRLA